jgi:hypothetical protein
MGVIPYKPDERVIETMPDAVYDIGCKGVTKMLDVNGEETNDPKECKVFTLLCEAILDKDTEGEFDNTLFHRVTVPTVDESAKDYKRNKFFFEDCCKAFGVDFSKGVDLDKFKDRATRALVTTTAGKDGGFFTNIKKFISAEEIEDE